MIRTKGITAHTLVKNEEKWIWFSIMSIIDYVDKMIIFDTGSTDKTADIIKDILKNPDHAKKIYFEERGSVNKAEFTLLRQVQIEMTETDWFLVLDGDEIWYKKDCIHMRNEMKTTQFKMLAIKFHNCTKDIYHYTSYESGGYRIKGELGNVTIKLISMNIIGIHADGPYGMEGYFDVNNEPIQNSSVDIDIIDGQFLHTSNLIRSKNLYHDWKIPYRRAKVFSNPEHRVNDEFVFPEVFYLPRPKNVPNPLAKAGFSYYFFKALTSPINALRMLKNTLR